MPNILSYLNSNFSECGRLRPVDPLRDALFVPLNLNETDQISTTTSKGNTKIIVLSSGNKIAQLDIHLNSKGDVDVVQFQLSVEIIAKREMNEATTTVNHTIVAVGSLKLFYSIPKSRPFQRAAHPKEHSTCKQLLSVKARSSVVDSYHVQGYNNVTLTTIASGEGRLNPGTRGNDSFKIDGKTVVQQKSHTFGYVKTAKEEKKGSETIAIDFKPESSDLP